MPVMIKQKKGFHGITRENFTGKASKVKKKGETIK